MYWLRRINMIIIDIRYRIWEVYRNRSKDWVKLDLSRMEYRRYMWIINWVLQKDLIQTNRRDNKWEKHSISIQ